MEAAERVRTLADWGLQELTDAEDHEARRCDAKGYTDPADPRRRAAIEAARQRAELARAERENQLVEHNAMTLISMVGALDAFVEELAPRARKMVVEREADAMVDRARAQDPDAAALVDERAFDALRVAMQQVLGEQLGSFRSSPKGAGANRWEDVLRHVGLHASSNRPIPADLDLALTEVVELRHVLAHRAGRVDGRALEKAPSLRYADGDLVRVTHEDYLMYSAALWTYGQEIVRRLLGDLAPAELTKWRQNYTLNA